MSVIAYTEDQVHGGRKTACTVEESDWEPTELERGDIEVVDEFPYLGSLVYTTQEDQRWVGEN